MNLREEKIISALIGLAGACGNNPKSENTDRIMAESLAFPLLNPDCDEKAVLEQVEKIYAEKNVVAPNCADCKFPCGNTSDYDMSRIYSAEENVRELKLKVLYLLEKIAETAVCNTAAADCDVLYRTLSLVSYDLTEERLRKLADETENFLNNNREERTQ
jgi:hydroxylamine reductase